jgi:uncharacterized protein DUF3800
MLVAYMDESGDHDPSGKQPGSEIAVIAGYVATKDQWLKFELRWKNVLKKFGVQVFHAKECAHRKNEFCGWADEKRNDFHVQLTRVINENILVGIGGVVLLSDYNSVLPEWAKREVKHPYYFCFAVMMRTLRQFRERFLPTEPIDFVFDRKKSFEGVLSDMFNHLRDNSPNHRGRLGSVSFRAKDEVIQLQAADYLAYEVRRYAADKFIGSTRPTRKTMESLMEQRHLAVGFYDAEDFEHHVDTRLKALGVRLS